MALIINKCADVSHLCESQVLLWKSISIVASLSHFPFVAINIFVLSFIQVSRVNQGFTNRIALWFTHRWRLVCVEIKSYFENRYLVGGSVCNEIMLRVLFFVQVLCINQRLRKMQFPQTSILQYSQAVKFFGLPSMHC